MINVPTIAILDTSEKYLGKIDNSIVNTLHIGKEKLTTYVTGAASLFEFSVLNKGYDEYAYLVQGNKLSFVYKGRNYYLTIMRVEENEVGKTILAMSASLEQTVEQTEPYKASSAHPISYYVGIFDPEKTITIGINQVASKTLTLEWEGQESRLARLLSLANKFDAEIEFVYELRNDHSLGKLVMNIYEKYSDGKGGMGQVRNDVKLRYGVDVKTISKTVDIQELYTAIRPYGTDGLTIADVEIAEYDSEGRLLYFSEKGSNNILAPQARDAYPSNLLGRDHDKYIALPWDYDTKNVNVLAGQALAKLKQISVPKAEYVIEGYFDLNLGDVVQIEDNGFTPTLLLSARVSEQVISWTEPQNNQTTFSNVVEQESQVSDDLLARVEALIDANKVYTGVITSTNGIVFKNNLGTTDLTAVVRDSSIDVTGNFSITWYKDGTEIAQTNTITVTADDVLQKAVYKFEAKDSEGTVKAVAEVTVSDVSDGERGEDGIGVASTKVEYQASTSGTTPPTGTWVGNPPVVSEGQYLWTRTTFTYTDSSTTLAYSISRMGADGEGVGIADVTITYQAGTSGTTPPTGTWSSTIPSVAANQFLWTRTVTTYTDGATSTAYSVGKMGANGADAQLLYLSASANVMKFDSNDIVVPSQSITITAKLQNASGTATWTAIPYIGNTAQTPITLAGSGNTRTLASGNWTNAAWTSVAITATLGSLTDTLSIVKVADGAEGADGADGKDGIGITSTVINYAQSTSGTTAPTTGWAAQVPTLVKGQYLWTRTVWTYSDSSTKTGYTVSYNAKDGNDGTDGIAGKDGVGISATVVEYVASTSGTVKPTTGWSTTIPTVPQGQYLWTRTTWTYTDSTSEQGFSVARQGANGTNGTNGTDGADGKDAQEVFSGYLTNESIVLPANAAGTVSDFSKANGTFVTFLGQNQLSSGVAYSLESATGITTTINATSGAYSVTAISADIGVAIYKAVYSGVTIRKQLMVVKARQGATGTNGTDGKDGVGVTNTVITYQAGSSGTTAPTGTWSSTIPSVSASQYLWTRTVWTFSDGTSKTGYSIGKMGENGAKGDTGATGATGATGNGIASAAIAYANSTSGTTVPTSGWVTTIPSVPAGNFLWTRTIFTYTNGNSNTSYAVAKQGEQGNPTGIISQNTVPAAADRYVGMLWKNTGASGYINGATYRWNGSAFELYIFIAENISVSNLAAISANLGTITAGTINGVTINGSTFVNTFSYTEGGVTYTGTTTMSGGNIVISRTGSNGSTWTTKVDRTLGFEDSYKAGATAPARTTRLGQGQLYMVESGVGGYLPAAALNPTSWTNLTYASGFTTAENNPCQYRMFPQLDGSTLIKFRGQFQLTNGGNFTTSSNLRPFGDGGIPAHIRPSKTEFAQGSSNRASGGRLAVTGVGNFFYNAETADQTYCSISAISYYI